MPSRSMCNTNNKKEVGGSVDRSVFNSSAGNIYKISTRWGRVTLRREK